jgi:hypothetical protein
MAEGSKDAPLNPIGEERARLAVRGEGATETGATLKKKPPAFCATHSHRTPPDDHIVSKSHIILNNQQMPFQFANQRFINPQSASWRIMMPQSHAGHRPLPRCNISPNKYIQIRKNKF